MDELKGFEPFDSQSLNEPDYWEWTKMKRMINILVDTVLEQQKQINMIKKTMEFSLGGDAE